MDVRDRIRTYATHGGAWRYLEKELVELGASEEFAKAFISRCRSKNLGEEMANFALQVFDYWRETESEEQAKLVMYFLL